MDRDDCSTDSDPPPRLSGIQGIPHGRWDVTLASVQATVERIEMLRSADHPRFSCKGHPGPLDPVTSGPLY